MTASTKRRAPKSLSPAMLDEVADRFKALAEPNRLLLLQVLQGGELAVGEIVERTGLSLANASKQLQQLHAAGFIQRRKEGLFVYYGLADFDVLTLCDLMCNRVSRDAKAAERALRAG
ncbi:MAG TPA: metalloregulator ArsR/SmtB family transcription factor [Gemmatimonadaceae bacterium]|jgi:DNA-binding transcriptional ArsR family regulator|nr:metalloregulator ArsR/SmtB family transcription factor [Gemmatimonadaceae bacterium]